MPYLLIFIFLGLLNSFMFAKESITVSGRFKDENRVINVSKEAQRLLFIKTKGNLVVPQRGFFLILSPASAKALGQDYIIIIPLDDDRQNVFYTDSKKDLSFQVQQLHPDEPSVFYTVNNDFSNRDGLKKDFFTHPQPTDVLQWHSITNYEYISHVKEWIDALESNESITVESQIYYEKGFEERGKDKSLSSSNTRQTTKQLMPLREIAKYRLHAVHLLFPQTDEEKWNRHQWLAWYENTLNIQPQSYTTCNPKTWNRETNYHEGFSNSALYATDKTSHRVFRLEKVPNYEEFKNQQLLIFDMEDETYYNYDIYSKDHPYATSFTLLHVENNILYAITENMRWYRYEYDKKSDQYRITKEVKLLPKEAYEQKKQWRNIRQAYHDGKTMYLLFQSEDEKENFLLSVDATTGENIHRQPLKNVLANSKIDMNSKTSFCTIHYAGQLHPDFYFCMSNHQNDAFYLLQTNASLESVKSIKISRDEAYGWVMADETAVYTIDDYEENMLVRTYARDLSQKLSQYQLSTPQSSGHGWIAKSSENVAVYRQERGLISTSIVKYEFNPSLTKELKKVCVYKHLPVEEITSETELKFFYASPIAHQNWLVFLKDGDTLRSSQTQ